MHGTCITSGCSLYVNTFVVDGSPVVGEFASSSVVYFSLFVEVAFEESSSVEKFLYIEFRRILDREFLQLIFALADKLDSYADVGLWLIVNRGVVGGDKADVKELTNCVFF